MRRTALYKHPLFLAHDTGRRHLESAERLKALFRELDDGFPASGLLFPSFSPASPATIQLNHSLDYVQKVAATADRVAVLLDPDTRTSPSSFAAALQAAGAVIDGIKRLVDDEIDNGFCLVRPPGHHAEFQRAMGFCLFNSIAIGAQWAIRQLGLERILLVDWDIHHGNGTQNSFYRSNLVLYCSIHQSPFYPGTGALHECGEGDGRGYSINVPLTSGHGDLEYARIFNQLITPLARAYQPQLVLVSCGFDLMAGDPIGAMRVTPAGIAYMTRVLRELADTLCEGRLLCVLEGGYDRDNIRNGTLAVLGELNGTPLAPELPIWLDSPTLQRFRNAQAASADIDQALRWVGTLWPLQSNEENTE